MSSENFVMGVRALIWDNKLLTRYSFEKKYEREFGGIRLLVVQEHTWDGDISNNEVGLIAIKGDKTLTCNIPKVIADFLGLPIIPDEEYKREVELSRINRFDVKRMKGKEK